MRTYLDPNETVPRFWFLKLSILPSIVTMVGTLAIKHRLQVNCGEGNGTPLQYSCLENPMGGGAWWAAIYGVAQNWTRLKQLSSSSSSSSRWIETAKKHWEPQTFFFQSLCSHQKFIILTPLKIEMEQEIATHSSILAWKIRWTEEPGGLQSMRLQESDTTEWLELSLDSKAVFFGSPLKSGWAPLQSAMFNYPLLFLPDFLWQLSSPEV